MSDEPPAASAPARRRRDSAGTRSALLSSARELFAERGYDRTTVRDIAAHAGVNQALLFRYFGSKDELFGAAMARETLDLLADGPPERVVARVLRRILDPAASRAEDQLLYAALLSGGHDTAAAVLRRELGDNYGRALASLTDAGDADVRADLVLAWLLGIGLLRTVLGKEPLVGADPEAVAAHVLRGVGTLLERTDPQPA